MGLKEYSFNTDYNKSENDIASEFYLPAMRNSCKYDRITGYFGSTVYIIAWSALQEFVENGGKIRIICSPVISETDRKALTEGYSAVNNEILHETLARELNELFNLDYLEKPSRALACLVGEGIIDLKIAVPESGMQPDLDRLFHDKVGIFTDNEGNAVGFRGSMNETFQGLSDGGNLESIDVFPSWEDQRDIQRLKNAKEYFESLWNRSEPHVLIYNFPDALKKSLIDKSNGYDWKTLVKEISTSISLSKKWSPDKKNPSKLPRQHQLIALENWIKNNYRGIFEHATGSGKTFTAICAIRNALDRGKSILILVPSKELLHQWKNELDKNIKDIKIRYLLCGDHYILWKSEDTLKLWTAQSKKANKITIATMDTACSDDFVHNVIAGPHLLLIADEVHRIGSPARRNILKIDAGERLGLSATPIRYGDPIGTDAIFKYFGGIVPPVFTLFDAINSGVLTKYYYYPLKVYLNDEEKKEWIKISKEISKIIAMYKKNNFSIENIIAANPKIQKKLIARARIVKQAANKIKLALTTIQKFYKNGQKWLIYCDNHEQLNSILSLLIQNDYDAYEYHSEMTGDRNETLRYFEKCGGIIVSIRCLDEGVDIPSATHALILASSKNPREFIQRRGRILRNYPGKYFAQLYDAVVIPEDTVDDDFSCGSIVVSELSRAIQFGKWAENKSCISDLRIIARDYNINYDVLKEKGFEDENEA